MNVAQTMLPPSPELREPYAVHVVYKRPPLWKRTIDIVGSLVLVVLLSPLLVLLCIFIKCVSRGPVIFRQTRVGAGSRPFVIYKFRTLKLSDDAPCHRTYVASLVDSDEPIRKPCHQTRRIPGGSFLRRFSLDELPQLFNVLEGTMSLVGPRPDVLKLEQYQPWQLRRFEVLPGISGLWQVSGKNKLTFNQMVRLDIEYIDSLGFYSDIKIMFKTLGLVLSQDNE